MKLSLAKINFF